MFHHVDLYRMILRCISTKFLIYEETLMKSLNDNQRKKTESTTYIRQLSIAIPISQIKINTSSEFRNYFSIISQSNVLIFFKSFESFDQRLFKKKPLII